MESIGTAASEMTRARARARTPTRNRHRAQCQMPTGVTRRPTDRMAFDHEKLDVYRLAVQFSGWVGERLEGTLKNSRTSAIKHLDEASGSIANNIAEGN